MKISCDVIRDLLPLYAEDMVSDASEIMVEEHLRECRECMSRLNDIRQIQCVSAAAADIDISSIQRVGDTIKKRRWMAVVFAALLALTISAGLTMFMGKRQYLPLEDAVVQVIEKEDTVEVVFSNEISNYVAIPTTWPEEEKDTVFLVAYTTRWDAITNANQYWKGDTFSCTRETVERIFYTNTHSGDFDTVIWGDPVDALVTSLPRLAMHYYFLIAVACAVILLISGMILRGKKAGSVLCSMGALFGCYALCSFLVAEGDWRVFDDVNFVVHLLVNVLLALLLWMTLLAGFKLRSISKSDKTA